MFRISRSNWVNQLSLADYAHCVCAGRTLSVRLIGERSGGSAACASDTMQSATRLSVGEEGRRKQNCLLALGLRVPLPSDESFIL